MESAYMYRPNPFLHVIRGEKVAYASKFMQQAILETEHRSWSDNSSFGEDTSDDFFSPPLRYSP